MTETFSETSDAEGLTAFCDPQIIPIFPLRFALKAEKLLKMIRANGTPRTPTSIEGMPDHELLRIRRGYVYTYDGADFQVFRFETKQGDENGAIYDARTDMPQAPAYRFVKYEWPNGVEGEWQPIKEYYPYAFVPKDTPVAWVAYSEAAWPNKMIFEAQMNAGFRDQVMTRVDLASRKGPYCAPITELAARVPAFREGSVKYKAKDYSVANAIRMTATEIEAPHAVVTCQNTADKGVMVALPDPIGEMQDILGLLSVHVMTLSNFTAEHQYPLMIGKAVKNYADNGDVSTSRLWVLTGPLSTEFEATYASLLAEMAALDAQMARLVWHWVEKMAETGFGSFRAQLGHCKTLAERYSLTAHPKDHSEVCAYALWLFARTKPLDAACGFLSTVASALFGSFALPVGPQDKLSSLSEDTKPWLDYAAKILTPGKEIHANFRPALNAVMTVYATEIVQASTSVGVNETSRLTAVMFSRHTVSRDRHEMQRTFRQMLSAEGYHNMSLPDAADQALHDISARRVLETSGIPGRVGFEEYVAQIDLTVDQNQLRFARYAESFDLGANGFGLVAALLSMHQTVSEWSQVRYDASAFGRAANDPRVQVIAAFSEAYAATYGLAKAGIRMTPTGVSASLATEIFGNAPRMVGTAQFRGASLLEGAVANKTIGLTARAAGCVGIVLSAAQAVEGYQRGDSLMAAGNGIIAVAAIALLFVSGPLAILAGAAIIVGSIMAALSYDEVQRWVKDGFWGTSSEYWGTPRLGVQARIVDARRMASSGPNAGQLKTFYEAELQRYIEMNATLEIKPLGNGRIEIQSQALQSQSDMSRLSVNVNYDPQGWQISNENIRGIRTVFVRPGVAMAVVPAGNYHAEDDAFFVEAALASTAEGSLTADKTLTERTLW